jgi:hypothetical protein
MKYKLKILYFICAVSAHFLNNTLIFIETVDMGCEPLGTAHVSRKFRFLSCTLIVHTVYKLLIIFLDHTIPRYPADKSEPL